MTRSESDLKICDHLLRLHERNKKTAEIVLLHRLMDEGNLDSETAEKIIGSQILDPSEMEEVNITKTFIKKILKLLKEE